MLSGAEAPLPRQTTTTSLLAAAWAPAEQATGLARAASPEERPGGQQAALARL